jgi:DNA transformation protein
VFVKVDAGSQPDFEAAGSSPFVYNSKGRAMPSSFWRLPAASHENADELRRWAALGLAGARRAAAAKGAKKRGKGMAAAKSKTKSPTYTPSFFRLGGLARMADASLYRA